MLIVPSLWQLVSVLVCAISIVRQLRRNRIIVCNVTGVELSRTNTMNRCRWLISRL